MGAQMTLLDCILLLQFAVCHLFVYRVFSDSQACYLKFCQVYEVIIQARSLHSCCFALTITDSSPWAMAVCTTEVLLLIRHRTLLPDTFVCISKQVECGWLAMVIAL